MRLEFDPIHNPTLLGKMMTRETLNHSIQKKSSFKNKKFRERASRRKCEPHPFSLLTFL